MNSKIKKIEMVPYNPNWPKAFAEEEKLLKSFLNSHCIHIHHIGSTSIVGMFAKPSIDIICIVDDLKSSLILVEKGYVFKGELNIPLRLFFSKNTTAIQINLHVVESDHGFISLNLVFRDYLRKHEKERLEYSKLKQDLLKDPQSYKKMESSFTGYNLGKDEFIKKILKKSNYEGLHVNFCMHYKEWEAYHRIKREQIFINLTIEYDENHPSYRDKNHYHIILYKGSEIVSIAQVELINEDLAALRSLATVESQKKKGYAKYLVEFLEKWIKYQERSTIKLHSNLDAESFYRKLNYEDVEFDDPCISKNFINLGKKI